jgi:hypothetical protein
VTTCEQGCLPGRPSRDSVASFHSGLVTWASLLSKYKIPHSQTSYLPKTVLFFFNKTGLVTVSHASQSEDYCESSRVKFSDNSPRSTLQVALSKEGSPGQLCQKYYTPSLNSCFGRSQLVSTSLIKMASNNGNIYCSGARRQLTQP